MVINLERQKLKGSYLFCLIGPLFVLCVSVQIYAQPCLVGVRNGHRLVYDDHRKKTMMFGGADASKVLGDLLEWDGKRWRCLISNQSLARTFPALAYDSRRKKIVMFGGNRVLFGKSMEVDTLLDDTWEWDGKKWAKLDVIGPSARAEAVMVYDSRRGQIVLFGGYNRLNGKTNRLGDTWEFDGKRWRQINTDGPSPRSGAAAIFNPDSGKVFLFGGNGLLSDTWEWDGKLWNKIATNQVEGRFNTVMAYDAQNKRIIRFGGWNGKNRLADMWQFDGKNWEQLNVAGPEPRNHSAMVYDSARRRIILFGGHDGENVFGDTWEFEGRNWSKTAYTDKQRRIENGH